MSFEQRTWAYDFECDKPMAEILSVLRAEGSWGWIERDKDAFGPYISSVPETGVRVRIYDLDGYDSNGPTYTADFLLRDDATATRSSVDAVFRTMLEKIGARNVTPGDFYD